MKLKVKIFKLIIRYSSQIIILKAQVQTMKQWTLISNATIFIVHINIDRQETLGEAWSWNYSDPSSSKHSNSAKASYKKFICTLSAFAFLGFICEQFTCSVIRMKYAIPL